jgi:hypothetical protein
MRVIAAITVAAVLAAGCAGSYTATVATDPYGPELVYVSPGVQVIADYNEPIFYSDGFYWRYYGGTWYRSHRYTGGWVYAAPPVAVLRIDRPYGYVRYRPAGWVSRRRHVAPAPAPAPAATVLRGRPAEPVRRPPPVYQPPRPAPQRVYPAPPVRGHDRRDDHRRDHR